LIAATITPPAGLTVLVLAGQREGAPDAMAARAGVSLKALIPVGGIPMLRRVIEALRSRPEIGRIIVSAERDDLFAGWPEQKNILTRRSEGSPSRSAAAILAEFGTPLLITTADHALLTGEMLGYFLEQAPALDVVAGVARADVIRAAYPETIRTWIKLRDGDFTGCNLFLLQSPRAAGVVDFWRRLEQQRKSPLSMARMIGPLTLLRYVLRLLSMQDALALLGQRTGARLAVVSLPFAEAAIDIDKTADLELATLALIRRRVA
jgi:GTP:adenosylcobinamide-phosphate guanylyltransferase